MEDRIKSHERDTGQSLGMTADQIVEMFTTEQYELQPERGHLLVSMCEMGLTVATHLRALDWTFLLAPHSRQFVVSDCPFVIVPPSGHDASKGGVGLRSRGAEKYVALRTGLCLRVGDTGTQVAYQSVTGTEVRKINCWTAQNSERFVFAGSEALLKRVIATAEMEAGKHRSEVIVREIPHATDPTRALLQAFSRPKIMRESSGE